jgi:hypothetical protein
MNETIRMNSLNTFKNHLYYFITFVILSTSLICSNMKPPPDQIAPIIPKPVRIVSGGGKDIQGFMQLAASERFNYYHQVFIRRVGQTGMVNGKIAPEEFNNYSAVIRIGTTGDFMENVMLEDNESLIYKYIETGGILVFPISLFKHKFLKNLPNRKFNSFAKKIKLEIFIYPTKAAKKNAPEFETETPVNENVHPLGIVEGNAIFKSHYYIDINQLLPSAGVETVCGGFENHNHTCYVVVPLGKGKLILIPDAGVLPAHQTYMDRYKNRLLSENDLRIMRQLTTNLFEYIHAPNIKDVIQHLQYSQPSPLPPVVFWYRPIRTVMTEGPEHLLPPYPLPGEQITDLELNIGRTEWERRLFFTTINKPLKQLKAKVLPFAGPSQNVVDHAEILALRAPHEAFIGPNVYLGRLEQLPPHGEDFIEVKRPASILWCLRLHFNRAAAGTYHSSIVFDADGSEFMLPIKVQVYNVNLDERYFDYEVEYCWQMNWADFNSEKLKRKVQLNCRDFKAHWMNVASAWYPAYSGPSGRTRHGHDIDFSKGKIGAQSPLEFLESPPMLDLSKYDYLFNNFIKHGLTKLRSGVNVDGLPIKKAASDILELWQQQLPNWGLERIMKRLGRWWAREHLRYFRDKGFTSVYAKYLDEWGESKLKKWLPKTEIFRDAGWKIGANPSYKLAPKIWSLVDIWWYAGCPNAWEFLPIADDIAEIPPHLPPNEIKDMRRQRLTSEFWTTLSSTYWWSNLLRYSYKNGWEMALLRSKGYPFSGYHLHGWFRDQPGGWGVYMFPSHPDCEEIYPGILYEMIGESLEDSQYMVLLDNMLDQVRRNNPRKAQQLEKGVSEILTTLKFDPPIQSRYTNAAMDVQCIPYYSGLLFQDFHIAKHALLNYIVYDVSPSTRLPDPSLMYGDTYLIREGRILAGIVIDPNGDPGWLGLINEYVKDKTGGFTFNVYTPSQWKNLSLPQRPDIFIILSWKDGELFKRYKGDYPEIGVTQFYPPKGSYLIYQHANGGKIEDILVIGGDHSGTELGCMNFTRFLKVKSKW